MPRVAVVCLLITLATGRGVEARIWTNDKGELLEANFVRVRDGVAILNANGDLIRAPIDRLAEGDRTWLKAYEAGKSVRDWKLADGTVRRGRLIDHDAYTAQFKMGRDRFELGIDELTASEQQLLRALRNTRFSIGPTVDKPGMTSSRRRSGEPVPLDNRAARTWTDVMGRQVEGEVIEVRTRSIVLVVQGKEFE
ncbi:MAG: hypothetical protein AAF589_05685 [Planctomycetota bacterium]